MNSKLDAPVSSVAALITGFVNENFQSGDHLEKPISDEVYAKVGLIKRAQKYQFQFEIEIPELVKNEDVDVDVEMDDLAKNGTEKLETGEGGDGEQTGESNADAVAKEEAEVMAKHRAKVQQVKEEVEKFNHGLHDKTRDFIILCGFKRAVQQVIAESALAMYKQGTSAGDHELIDKLTIIFDFQMYLVREYPLSSSKQSFYQTLAEATDSLFLISTNTIMQFWNYLEVRRRTIQQHVFDANATGDRIAILEICNNLTDRYNNKSHHALKKTDTFKKDTFNDEFQARVRLFLGNLLTLEDNTGLNKYFSTADIISQDILTSIGTSKKDDKLLRDIIQLNKLFRDPYYYIKLSNHKLLLTLAITMNKVVNYLLDEEEKYYAKNPIKDQFGVPNEQESGENRINGECFTSDEKEQIQKLYFPEIYTLAAFDHVKRGEKYEELKRKDTDFIAKQFDNSETMRHTAIAQIYFICTLYAEMSGSKKREFFKNIGAGGSGLKHFVDDILPEHLTSTFFRMKKEITRRYKVIDSQFGHLLGGLALTELYWWSWLIYGKDSALGKPLFADKVLSHIELETAAENSRTVLPLKEKKYFNTYATPQLTRKMKVTTGLQKLKGAVAGDKSSELRRQMDAIKLRMDENPRDEEIIREYNITYWKLLKSERSSKWLKFGDMASKDAVAGDLSDPEPEPEQEQNQEQKSELELPKLTEQPENPEIGGETSNKDSDASMEATEESEAGDTKKTADGEAATRKRLRESEDHEEEDDCKPKGVKKTKLDA